MSLLFCSRTEQFFHSVILLSLLSALSILSGGRSVYADPTAGLCHQAAAQAASSNNVPRDVLTAIMLTETGRTIDGRLQPWPWTINTGESGHWFPDRETALRFAEDLLRAGRRSFDVGCFQINFRWHGSAFTSIDEMFAPASNARYAAEFLTSLVRDSGDWSVAAGAYHSRTPELAERYRARFDAILADIGSPSSAITDHGNAPGGYHHPLLQPRDGSRTPGSLVQLSVVPST
jgi:hypothetical protein